jgi:hypothetical protein
MVCKGKENVEEEEASSISGANCSSVRSWGEVQVSGAVTA